MFENGTKVKFTNSAFIRGFCNTNENWTGTVITNKSNGTFYLVRANKPPHEMIWVEKDCLEEIKSPKYTYQYCFAVVDPCGNTIGVFTNITKAREFAAADSYYHSPNTISLEAYTKDMIEGFIENTQRYTGLCPVIEAFKEYNIEKVPLFTD